MASSLTAPRVYKHVGYFRLRAPRLKSLLRGIDPASASFAADGRTLRVADPGAFERSFAGGKVMTFKEEGDARGGSSCCLRVLGANGTLQVTARTAAGCARIARAFAKTLRPAPRRTAAAGAAIEPLSGHTHVVARFKPAALTKLSSGGASAGGRLHLERLAAAMRGAAPAGWSVSHDRQRSAALRVRAAGSGCSVQLFATGKLVAVLARGLGEFERFAADMDAVVQHVAAAAATTSGSASSASGTRA
jgi:hypothetical protein